MSRFKLSTILTRQIFAKYSTPTSSLAQNYFKQCSIIKQSNFNVPKLLPTTQFLHKAIATNDKSIYKQESTLVRLLNKLPFVNINRTRLNVAAFMMYESIVDGINYANFFEEFALPDTFYSWFAVTELHLWMLSVRAMAEGDDGRFVRNCIAQALWSDVGLRIKKLGAVNPSSIRGQVTELSEQFQAALIAYDEGLQTNDMILAGALWRRLYQQKDADPEHLDSLIKYIRKQLRILEHMPKEEFLSQKLISWGSRT